MSKVRLNKKIADAGITSRRKAEQLILDGQVKVNDKVCKELATFVTDKDKVEVNGIPIENETPIYILYHKPTGEVSTVSDDKDRRTVVDKFDHLNTRIYPVGRLDYDTSGILLLTNDGEFTNYMTHPRYEVEKTYRAKINKSLTNRELKELENGVMLEDGKTSKSIVEVIRDKKDMDMIVQLTITEGRNHQVRRMFEYFDAEVIKLKRIGYDFLTIEGVPTGEYRFLTPHEVKQLVGHAKAVSK